MYVYCQTALLREHASCNFLNTRPSPTRPTAKEPRRNKIKEVPDMFFVTGYDEIKAYNLILREWAREAYLDSSFILSHEFDVCSMFSVQHS